MGIIYVKSNNLQFIVILINYRFSFPTYLGIKKAIKTQETNYNNRQQGEYAGKDGQLRKKLAEKKIIYKLGHHLKGVS